MVPSLFFATTSFFFCGNVFLGAFIFNNSELSINSIIFFPIISWWLEYPINSINCSLESIISLLSKKTIPSIATFDKSLNLSSLCLILFSNSTLSLISIIVKLIAILFPASSFSRIIFAKQI